MYIEYIEEESAAEEAGIEIGDIIKKVDEIDVHKYPDLTGYLSTKRPGDTLEFVINRNTPHSNFDNVVLLHWTLFCANVVVLFPSPAASRVGLLKVDFSYNSLFLCLGRNTKISKTNDKLKHCYKI